MADATKQARVLRAPMGGAWIVPLTDEGREMLAGFFGEAPASLAPISAVGWIVEPYQTGDLAEALRAAGMAWEVI